MSSNVIETTTTEATSQTSNAKIVNLKIPDESKNLILGSSITARIRTETMPNATIIHSYRGSSAEEKIKFLSKYSSTEIKDVVVQD